MKRILMIAVIALVAISCDKNQKAVKKLDGTWEATEAVVNLGGVTIDAFALGLLTSITYTFEGCKLKDDEYCGATMTIVTDGETESNTGVFTVTDDGETLEIKDDAATTDVMTLEILELTKSELKVKQIEGAGTEEEIALDLTFEKQ